MEYLQNIALEHHLELDDRDFAILMDTKDPLKDVRQQFEYPKKSGLPAGSIVIKEDDEDCVYLGGNSLGLMPKSSRGTMNQVMDQWATWGVVGHDHGPLPWQLCDEQLLDMMAPLVGASSDEVAIMNGLTVNLHLLMISFYKPTATRYKILHESKPFPSDQYALESHVRMHGLDPSDALLSVGPRPGEHCIRTEDVLSVFAEHGASIALVSMSAMHFYTGEFMDMEVITKEAHEVGAYVGWDLAHAVGNVELSLHKWEVDWAVWCTYKYLNAGPGASGAAFLHSKHFDNSLPYLTGWWGHEYLTRMSMPSVMQPGVGIRRYRMSNPSPFHSATLRASLEIFQSVGMKTLRDKSILLSSYLEYLLDLINTRCGRPVVEILTPRDSNKRGAQISVVFLDKGLEEVHNYLTAKGLVCDVRKPNVIRLAGCPMYNSFLDIHRAFQILYQVLSTS